MVESPACESANRNTAVTCQLTRCRLRLRLLNTGRVAALAQPLVEDDLASILQSLALDQDTRFFELRGSEFLAFLENNNQSAIGRAQIIAHVTGTQVARGLL